MAKTTISPRPNPTHHWLTSRRRSWIACAGLVLSLTGCTSPRDFIANGFKVGPNYTEPPTPVAADWIKAKDWNDADAKMPYMDKKTTKTLDELNLGPAAWAKADELTKRNQNENLSNWWTVFKDPMLDKLICHAYHQNLPLRQAAYQVLAARAQLGQTIGNFLPQSQYAYADFNRNADSTQTAFAAFIPKRFYSQFDYNFNLAWELDVWGKFRRAIENANDTLDAQVFNYDDVLVTLLSDVATYYVTMRVYEERIRYARQNVLAQQKAVDKVVARKQAGVAKQLDVDQVKAVLYQTAATIPVLETGLRTANNQLCVLLGVPMEDLRLKLGPPHDAKKAIPYAPPDVAVGIPADLLRRRPDVREAERQAAAQCAEIGYAEADFYPHISLVGDFGWSAAIFRDLFNQYALAGSIGPQVQWNLFNYGRILNNMRTQDATFQAMVAQYQNTVLVAQQEVENGLVTFLKAQQGEQLQQLCVKHLEDAHGIILAQYEAGVVDISQLVLILQSLATQQDALAQAQGQVATGLIMIYRAMGGGWELRETGCEFPGDHAADPTEPMRKKGFLLPTPRILKEAALPYFEDASPVNGQADPSSADPHDDRNPAGSNGASRSQPFEKAMPSGPGDKKANAGNDPFPLPPAPSVELPIPPRPAEIGVPQVDPAPKEQSPMPQPSAPVPGQVAPLPPAPHGPAPLPELEPIVPILPKLG